MEGPYFSKALTGLFWYPESSLKTAYYNCHLFNQQLLHTSTHDCKQFTTNWV